MNAMPAVNLFMSPYMMWSRLAWRTAETAISSAQVIGHRSSRVLLSGSAPSARDQREFTLMGREKSDAVLESAQAIGVRALLLNQQFVTLAFKQLMSATVTLMSIASSRTVAESVERQTKLVRETMTGSAVVASKLSGSTARIARGALKPVHKRVSANAKRLGKRRIASR